jgi:F-type H+-transporting ATPase subunit epsilon
MHLKLLLPFGLYADKTDVSEIVAETRKGSFGILPHRLDCVAALSAGILTYRSGTGVKTYVAVDEGVLVKTGFDVIISVRRAISGTELGSLKESLQKEFLNLNEQESLARQATVKLENGVMRRLVLFHHE